ncbi:MAG: hypothetical protein E4G91_02025 [Candidatus Zixiibacteriota bacterium]|nr:MAG: hypothetical protein E4G91_02025 [candidate division Zixibacteria bacterium]
MLHRYSVFVVAVIMVFCFGSVGATPKYSTVRITVDKTLDYQVIQSLGLDIVGLGEGYAEAILAPGDLERLQSTGLKYTITIDDMTAFYRSRLDPSRAMGGYRTLSEIDLVLDSIYNAHPEIVTAKWSIGNSIEGRPIWVIKISDNPNIDEDESEVYYYAVHHAREVITPEVLIYFMRYLTDNYGTDPQVTYLVDNRELFFSTCLNPDGYYFNEQIASGGGGMWRKNRRENGDDSYGVDLNRNYDYAWGYDDFGSSPIPLAETYRGAAPFSEPEIQAHRDFINSRHFKVIANYHSAMNLFLYPWGYDEITCPDEDIFARMGDSVHAMTDYMPGPPWRVLYAVNGGSTDWEYGEQTTKEKIFAANIEVGNYYADGFWPPVSRITPLVQLHVQPNLFYASIADSIELLLAPAPPSIYAIGDVDTAYFQLYWHHSDQYNPAQSFEVWQMQDVARITDSLERQGPIWVEEGFTFATNSSHSTTHSYFSGNRSNIDTRLTTGQALRVGDGDTLQFWTSYIISSGWDYGYVEISIDGGSSWGSIPGSITTQDDPNGQNLGHGITGSSSGWKLAKFPLTQSVGQDILYRFRYVTDGSENNAGWYIDDIYPAVLCTTSVMLTDTVTDSTFFVTDIEPGDNYYRVRAKDTENQFSSFSPIIMARVSYNEQCPWQVADANNDGITDISDAVNLIGYIFSSGPAPIPNAVGSGDADCSGAVDISDAVYLISYIFSGGGVPGATCDCKNY